MKLPAVILILVSASVPPAFSQVDLLASWDGNVAGEQFGIALTLGGDANGDGRADLAVGSSTSDEAGQNAGKVSIFFGRAVPAGVADLEITGDPGSFFGAAVAWVGDVNGDHYDDLLVGAFLDSTAGASAGRAYLFLGGNPMDAVADVIITGTAAGDYLGRAVGAAGDLNGDGYMDFAVGAPRTVNGTVYVFFGGVVPDGTADLVLHGAAAGDQFGGAIAGPGNVDGIAGDDLLIGAPRSSALHTWEGAAYVYSGGPSLDTLADWTVAGAAAGDQFGLSVAAAGDINGDGELDIAVGAPYANTGAVLDAGAAYVFYGGSLLDGTADFTVRGSAEDDWLGRSVAGCGDVTGSGFDHLVIGVPGSNQGGADTGFAFLSPGGAPPLTGDLISIQGEAIGDQFGYAVAGSPSSPALSFSGDTNPDFAVGAWSNGVAGRSYVYGAGAVVSVESGSGSGRVEEEFFLVAPNPGRSFTFHVSVQGKRSEPLSRDARIRIVDITGRQVRLLPLSPAAADRGGITWDGYTQNGYPASTGTYYGILEDHAGARAVKRLTLLR